MARKSRKTESRRKERQKKRDARKSDRKKTRTKKREHRQATSRRTQRGERQAKRAERQAERQAKRAERASARQTARAERKAARSETLTAAVADVGVGAAETAEYVTKGASDLAADVYAGGHEFGMEYADDAAAAVGAMYGLDLTGEEALAELPGEELATSDEDAGGLPWWTWAGAAARVLSRGPGGGNTTKTKTTRKGGS